jgi:hypothetical protein
MNRDNENVSLLPLQNAKQQHVAYAVGFQWRNGNGNCHDTMYIKHCSEDTAWNALVMHKQFVWHTPNMDTTIAVVFSKHA